MLSILKGETTAAEAARKHGLTVADVEHWKDTVLLAAENALRSRPKDEEALHQEPVKKLERKVGQLVMELDIAREAMKLYPFPETTSDESGRRWPAARSGWCAGCWAWRDRRSPHGHAAEVSDRRWILAWSSGSAS